MNFFTKYGSVLIKWIFKNFKHNLRTFIPLFYAAEI